MAKIFSFEEYQGNLAKGERYSSDTRNWLDAERIDFFQNKHCCNSTTQKDCQRKGTERLHICIIYICIQS